MAAPAPSDRDDEGDRGDAAQASPTPVSSARAATRSSWRIRPSSPTTRPPVSRSAWRKTRTCPEGITCTFPSSRTQSAPRETTPTTAPDASSKVGPPESPRHVPRPVSNSLPPRAVPLGETRRPTARTSRVAVIRAPGVTSVALPLPNPTTSSRSPSATPPSSRTRAGFTSERRRSSTTTAMSALQNTLPSGCTIARARAPSTSSSSGLAPRRTTTSSASTSAPT